MKNEVIKLITIESGKDADGFKTEEKKHSLEVMAEIKSVRYNEFYQAAHAGFDVKLQAAVNIEDYNAAFIRAKKKKIRPSQVLYDDVIYKIIRVYQKKKKMELTLQEME